VGNFFKVTKVKGMEHKGMEQGHGTLREWNITDMEHKRAWTIKGHGT
jgi:hypothetical protein